MLRENFNFVIFVNEVVSIVVSTFIVLIVQLCAITFCWHLKLPENFVLQRHMGPHAVKTYMGLY